MKTFPIQWHEDRLRCLEASAVQAHRKAVEAADNATRLSGEVEFCRHQIATARKRGIAAFDPDKFQKKFRHFWEGK